MPPSAAPEWLRVGWSFEMTATLAPASCASMAARIPAQPAPTTRTSWVASTWTDASGSAGPVAAALVSRAGRADRGVDVAEPLREVLDEHVGELTCLDVVLLGVPPGRARVEKLLFDAVHLERNLEAEKVVQAE